MDALIAALSELEQAKTLHVLVNNSGVSWGSPFDDVPEDKGWDNIMAVNVKGLFYRKSPLLSLGRTVSYSSLSSPVTVG